MNEDRLHPVGQHVEDVRLLEAADQREQRDVEEHGAPIELLHDVLETRRIFQLVAHDLDDQHKDDSAGQRDESEFHAQELAHRHGKHGQQEHADCDESEQSGP